MICRSAILLVAERAITAGRFSGSERRELVVSQPYSKGGNLMVSWNRRAKINVKVLIILLLLVVALGTSLFAARHIRRRLLSKMDLNAGLAAYEKADWRTASEHLQEYLGRNPDDLEILRKYAESRLKTWAPEVGHIRGAISAYRRIIQLEPGDAKAYEQLAELYTYLGIFSELKYIADKRIENNIPDDRKAPLWLCVALARLDKPEEAKAELEKFIAELDELEDKPQEYVEACTLMSEIILGADSDRAGDSGDGSPLSFFTKAVNGVPTSAEALANRARFYRARSQVRGITEAERSKDLEDARADLEAADKLGTQDPSIRSALCLEWMAHNDPNRASDELVAVDALAKEVIEEHFLDVNDWVRTRFILASDLALRKRDTAKAASLADEVLDVLTEKRHRVDVLDPAIISYVSDGNAVV